MFAIYALSIYGLGMAILGAITLASIPGWRITKGNLLSFVLGGFVGMFALANLAALVAPYLLSLLGIRGGASHGELLGYAVVIIGAELGGLGLVFLKSLIHPPTC